MGKPLRLLIIEDSEDDTLLLVMLIRDAGYDPEYRRVQTREAMCAALEERLWDIIIADFSMPHFNGPEALEILERSGLDIPFILVSGVVTEQTALRMMDAGAQDFILKQDLSRLVPVIARELRQAEERAKRRRAEEALKRSEENFRSIFEHMPAAIFAYDREGIILQANPACEQLFNLPRDRLVGYSLLETVGASKDREEIRQRIDYVFSGQAIENIEWKDRLPDGTEKYILTSVTPVFGHDGKVIMGLSLNVDITERRQAEQRERELELHKLDFYNRTLLAATEGRLAITEKSEVDKVVGSPLADWRIESASDLSAVRKEATRLAQSEGLDEERAYNLVLAGGEALTNAIKHAGGGTAALTRNDDSLFFVVRDNGPGIEALNLPEVALTRGYSTAGTLGMGYKAMISLADKVYLATGPQGTTVAVEVKLNPEENRSIWRTDCEG